MTAAVSWSQLTSVYLLTKLKFICAGKFSYNFCLLDCELGSSNFSLLTRFSNGKLVIKMMNVGGRAGGGEGVGRASTIGFRSITPKPFEIFE